MRAHLQIFLSSPGFLLRFEVPILVFLRLKVDSAVGMITGREVPPDGPFALLLSAIFLPEGIESLECTSEGTLCH